MRTVIGVMGGSVADEATVRHAYDIGRLIAEHGLVLLTGGRDAGVMSAASHGASEAGGLVIGILPSCDTSDVSPHVDIAIPTGMGDARNLINVLSSRVVVALPGGAGTISEIALALKNERPVIVIGFPLGDPFERYYTRGLLRDATDAVEAMRIVVELIGDDA